MKWKDIVQEFEEKSAISGHLGNQIRDLTSYLEDIIDKKDRNNTLINDLAELPQLAASAFDEGDPEALQNVLGRIGDLSTDHIAELLRYYTVYFHLVNSLEQREITRLNRERAYKTTAEAPRGESIFDAVYRLKEQGYSREEALNAIGKLDIQPTITAHPTEARRHSILVKQQNITSIISKIEQESFTPDERKEAIHEILNEINLLLSTDEVRTEKVTVEDEVENGMFFFINTIWDTIPKLYSDLNQAFETYYDTVEDFPVILQYRSWIGSDRDGNPNVTPDVTWQTGLKQREIALDLYIGELDELRRYLSISDNHYTISDALQQSIQKDEAEYPLSERYRRLYRHEPYRRKLTHIMEKLRYQRRMMNQENREAIIEQSGRYTSDDFVEELEMIRSSIYQSGLREISEYGKLKDLIFRTRTFGFHMASLDIRQHSQLHEETMQDLLEIADVTDRYSSMDENEKIEVLTRELSNPRPLTPINSKLSDDSRAMLDVFKTIRDVQRLDPKLFGSYIISMTHAVSDMLEVLVMAKEAGLWSVDNDTAFTTLDVVPLFETIGDLKACDSLMAEIYENRMYRKQLEGRNNFQEIMLGYSDSNKDGGYWMANWSLEKAQRKLGTVCRNYNVDFRLFHGRGGSVGRGGGLSNEAISALPPISNNGRIRFTEQGEVISFRYSLASIAHRHLEQIVHAMVHVTEAEDDTSADDHSYAEIIERLSDLSMKAYRDLIDDEDFWKWYTDVTPIEHISRLPIASRPVSRKGGKAADFDNLRAIPWVFAWTQVRYNVPGWFGIGDALQTLINEDQANLEQLKQWYSEWLFFKTVLDNAQREMARTHLQTARRYSEQYGSKFHNLILDDYRKAEEAILAITGNKEILDHSMVIKRSIRFRNPFTYPLNFMQIELLRRWHDNSSNEDTDRIRNAVFLSINGIAAAMQSTG